MPEESTGGETSTGELGESSKPNGEVSEREASDSSGSEYPRFNGCPYSKEGHLFLKCPVS